MSDTPQFEQMYECCFTETKEEAALRALAREYHERTEAFDQSWCRMRNEHGIAVPVGQERVMCNRFALEQRRWLGEHAAYLGFPLGAWSRAIGDEARSFERDWVNGRYKNDPRFRPFSPL